MTSWNTIVSGNQAKIIENPTSCTKRQQLVHSHPQAFSPQLLSVTSKDQPSNETKPQKVSPIFGSQQKHAIKKPTAHVKPLKNIQVDGFTTVQHFSRQGQQLQQATGSRVSELDDFSTDLVTRAAVTGQSSQSLINIQEYPPVVSSTQSKANTSGTSGNKKRKKKGKDNIEPISEVINKRDFNVGECKVWRGRPVFI